MNAFEPLLWMGCVWCVVRAINLGQPQYWFWLGVLTGVGLETKYSIAFLVFGILVGALLGPERHFLKSPWLWSGMLVAAILALPNFLWQLHHDFPFLQAFRTNHGQSGS
jgi:4-amino-4-deoxy-L-arabinose transferase-like glycosyltransferase